MKYTYPAVFRPEEKGFSIFFPDVRMGGTQGDNITDGLEMAHDFLFDAYASVRKLFNRNLPPRKTISLSL